MSSPFDSGSRIYNSKIFQLLMDYSEQYYPHVNMDSVCARSGLSRADIMDSATWLSQDQGDRFCESLLEETGNEELFIDVGRYASSAKNIGIVKQYLLGMISVGGVFRMMSKFYNLYSLGAVITAKNLSSSSAEIISTPAPGVREKSFQCQYRMGVFEAIPELFNLKPATVVHPQCYHRGDAFCRYIISWEKSASGKAALARNITFLVTFAAIPVIFLSQAFTFALKITAVIMLLNVALQMIHFFIENRELKAALRLQGDSARSYITEINERYRSAALMKDIGQASAALLDIDLLLDSVSRILKKHLPYDRGLIMLYDQDSGTIRYGSGYGFNLSDLEFLKGSTINIRNNEYAELTSMIFSDDAAMIINDVEKIRKQFGKDLYDLHNRIGGASFVCVPIRYKREAVGVLCLGNVHRRHNYTDSEIVLMKGLASQIAVSISNAKSVSMLQESEKRLNFAMEATSDGIWDFNTLTNEIVLSPRSYDILGLSPGEVEITFQEWMQRLHPDDLEEFLKSVFAKISTDNPVTRFEFRLRTNSGLYKWLQGNAHVAAWDEQGAPLRLVGTLVDIHERKMAEKALKEEKLRAEKSDHLKSAFLANMSHEIRTPLNAILGYTELLLDDEPDEGHREYIHIIHESGSLLLSLVNDIIDLSRIESGNIELNNVPCSLSGIMHSVESNARIAIVQQKKEITLIQKFDTIAGSILCDPHRLQQIMNNLLGNAIKFTQKGRIEYGFILKEHLLDFFVSDTGIGISPAMQDKIFERFQQGDTSMVREYGGSGLGLTISKFLIELMGGRIWVESEGISGRGSSFHFTLPYVPSTTVSVAENDAGDHIERGARYKVLVAEDNAINQKLIQRMLEKSGFDVDIAANGIEAMKMIRQGGTYDLVLMDVQMPGMDGYETTRLIREHERAVNTYTPVVAITAHAMQDDMEKCLNAGCDDYISKPIGMNAIRSMARKYLKNG